MPRGSPASQTLRARSQSNNLLAGGRGGDLGGALKSFMSTLNKNLTSFPNTIGSLEFDRIRIEFAKAALTGMLASWERGNGGRLYDFKQLATDAWDAANAMMVETY